jgi:hypothetical protein
MPASMRAASCEASSSRRGKRRRSLQTLLRLSRSVRPLAHSSARPQMIKDCIRSAHEKATFCSSVLFPVELFGTPIEKRFFRHERIYALVKCLPFAIFFSLKRFVQIAPIYSKSCSRSPFFTIFCIRIPRQNPFSRAPVTQTRFPPDSYAREIGHCRSAMTKRKTTRTGSN